MTETTDGHLFPDGDVVAHLAELVDKKPDQAATLCRAVLAERDLDDAKRERVESLLEQTMDNPVAWREAVLQWARDPSLEGWRRLMRFVRPDDYYDRLRDACAYLRGVNVDANLLFRCLTDECGATPDVQSLVATGDVRPEVVGERADKAPPGAAGIWHALAARAALARGDELGVVRWLTRAHASQTDRELVDMNTHQIWLEADDQLCETLEQKGLAPAENLWDSD